MREKQRKHLTDTFTLQRRDILFAAACLVLILAKHMLASLLPISPRPSYKTDDHLLVMMARNLLRGNWLGGYGYGTLMKGSFYPMFLAAAHLSGISYITALDLMNSLAALYFTFQLKPILRKRRWMLILFTVLLFNPVTVAEWTFGRIYRSSLTNLQVLFLFGAVIGMYLDQKSRFGRRMIRACFAGFVLWSTWNTREDAIWVLPFVVIAGFVVMILQLRDADRLAGRMRAVALFLIPFIIFFSGNAVITAINQQHYGLPIRNEASANFGKMIKTMYSIKNQEDHEYVSVPAEKLERMYAVSPTLSLIREDLEKTLQQADSGSDRNKNDGNVEDGWFYWCVRRAVENSGIAKTLPEADLFYQKVNQELEEAVRDPANHFETQWVMPSALMSPWREGYAEKFIGAFGDAVVYSAGFKELSAKPRIVEPSVERMSYLFEGITGNASIHSEENMVAEYRQIYIDRAEFAISVYQRLNPIIALLSGVLFIAGAVGVLCRKDREGIRWLLATAGLGLSFVLLLIGITYTDMTAFIAIRYTYLSGGYALMLAFEWMTLLYAAERGFERWKRRVSDGKTNRRHIKLFARGTSKSGS